MGRGDAGHQAPVASDLRLVLAVLHDSIHLERIGDQCVTIAKLTKLAADLELRHDLVEGLTEMGERAEEMVRVALDSLSARDIERARGLVELDELIDRTNRRVCGPGAPMATTPGTQEWGMRMIVVSRCIERIGDNAVDIGEQTAFLVTGEFHEFTDASHRRVHQPRPNVHRSSPTRSSRTGKAPRKDGANGGHSGCRRRGAYDKGEGSIMRRALSSRWLGKLVAVAFVAAGADAASATKADATITGMGPRSRSR